MVLCATQCQEARILLHWTLERLALEADIAPATVRRFEARERTPREATLYRIKTTLECAGGGWRGSRKAAKGRQTRNGEISGGTWSGSGRRNVPRSPTALAVSFVTNDNLRRVLAISPLAGGHPEPAPQTACGGGVRQFAMADRGNPLRGAWLCMLDNSVVVTSVSSAPAVTNFP